MLSKKTGIFALLGSVIIWGSTFVITKYLMNDIGPFLVTGLRLVIAILAITPFGLRRGFKWQMLKERQFYFYGLTGVTLYFGFANTGLVLSTPANAALIQSVNPAAVVLLSILFLKEKVSLQWGIGIGLSILGVLLITGIPSKNGISVLFGNLLIVGSVIAWAVYTIQGKKMTGTIDPLAATTASFYTGLIWLLPLIGWELLQTGFPRITPVSWMALVYLGSLASALAYFLWNKALRSLDASIAGPFINLIPIIGLVLAAVTGEQITPVQIIGGSIAIIGVVITQNFVKFPKGLVHENTSSPH